MNPKFKVKQCHVVAVTCTDALTPQESLGDRINRAVMEPEVRTD